jgi:hypothetical protein
MKYAILGPRKGILNIRDTATAQTVELTDEQAAAAEALRAAKKIPFFIDGEVTSMEEMRTKGVPRFNEETSTWEYLPAPTPPTPPVPRSVDGWRMKAALELQGLLTTVEGAIAAMPDSPEKTVVDWAWKGNSAVERRSPTVTALAQILSLGDEQLDTLFRLAASFKP